MTVDPTLLADPRGPRYGSFDAIHALLLLGFAEAGVSGGRVGSASPARRPPGSPALSRTNGPTPPTRSRARVVGHN